MILMAFIFILPWVCMLIFQFQYFLVSEEYLTVRRAFWPGWQQSYKRADILKIDYITSASRNANGIKITFSNFSTKIYRSYIFNYDMFLELQKITRQP